MTFRELLLTHLPLVLLSAKATLLWVLANYTYPADPPPGITHRLRLSRSWLTTIVLRSLILAAFVIAISGGNWGLGIFAFTLAIALPLARNHIARSYLAELELGVNLLFLAGTPWLAAVRVVPLPASRWSSSQEAAVALVIAIGVFVLRGGTYIVQGVLEKGKTLPARPVPGSETSTGVPKKEVDRAEYNRGRIIGNVERLMLLAFVAMQAYQALAFLITAKGLFRAKDIEQADFAEYFLVGTLTSSLIAIAAGLGIQFVLRSLW